MGILSKNFMPNAYVQSIHEIDFDKLADNGIKGVITDLDLSLIHI